jgi:hypothetical protein
MLDCNVDEGKVFSGEIILAGCNSRANQPGSEEVVKCRKRAFAWLMKSFTYGRCSELCMHEGWHW